MVPTRAAVGGRGGPTSGETPAERELQAVQALTRASKVLERASGELGLAHYRVLSAIAAGDERASRIAARLVLGKPTISAAVDSLCGRGLLTRSAVAGDQRATQLALTEKGAAVLGETETAMTRAFEELLTHVDRPETIVATLITLNKALDRAGAERRLRA